MSMFIRSRMSSRNKEETRDALITAAVAEFAEHGLDASLDAVCARAKLTRGAFYVHFKDRDDLVVAAIDRVLSRHQDTLLSGDTDLSRTIARYIGLVASGEGATVGTQAWRFRHTLDACARVPKVRERYLELQQRGRARVAASVEAGQDAGKVRGDVDASAIADLLVVLSLGLSAASDIGLDVDLLAGGAALQRLLQAKTRPR